MSGFPGFIRHAKKSDDEAGGDEGAPAPVVSPD